jgi:TolB-like protein
MRQVLLIALVALAGLVVGPRAASAKPKVAVAPFEGDAGNKVTDEIAELLSDKLAPVKQREVTRAMTNLGLSGELDAKDARKLQRKLEVVAVVHGKLGKDGRRKTLQLSVSARKKKTTRFTVEYTKASSDKFRSKVHDELVRRILAEDDTDDEDQPAETKPSRRDDDDGRRKPRVATADDDGDAKVRKKKRRRKGEDSDDDASPRAPGSMAVVALGPTFGVRRLTYTASGPNPPPRVGTGAPSVRIAGEVYPFAGNPGAAAGFGLAGEYDKTFGLGIEVPGTGIVAPINEGHYALGARYRFAVGGASTIAVGLDYARRHYIADRSGLAAPAQLDAPDVDYTAIVPNAALRTPVAPKIVLFVDAGAMLIRSTGGIQESTSYGAADVFGVQLDTGLDYAVAKQIALRFAADYGQINFKFKGKGDLATARGVTAATDRTFGVAGMLAVTY